MKYFGEGLKEIVFPLGGIGTGSVGLAGNGCLVDWEIFNRPNKGSINGYSFFAVKAEYPDGSNVTKVLQGDMTKELMGQYSRTYNSGYGFGADSLTMCGFPHFKKLKFDGRFPIAKLTFKDDDFPAEVVLTAFNPFIPLDADNSGIPAAFFEIKIKSLVENVKYSVILSVTNPFESSINERIDDNRYTAVKLKCYGKAEDDKDYGDMTVTTDCKDGICQEYWYRGKWKDKVTTFWYDLTCGALKNRRYSEAGKGDVCSVGESRLINRGEEADFRFLISWNMPNNYNYWSPYKDENGNDITWKNYYAVRFKDSVEACFYSLDNWAALYKKTERFCRSLHSATLDKTVIDAVSSTLSVLKSPTVLRLEDGTFYGWEGVEEKAGSCEGSCTHVWSYAYALSFLFPELERSLRDTELRYNTDEYGKMQFRTKLPLGRERDNWHACVDGQMATIIKIYRDWKLTGNSDWLKANWNEIKKLLEFAWSEHNAHEWDKNKDGVLEGRQHHTLDMELFGPSSWLEGMYLAALKAAAEMADFLGNTDKRDEYTSLFENGFKWTRENLFNGKYFFQAVEIENKEITEHFDCPNYWDDEKGQLKYQIGEGCEIDQLLAQWHANICGLGDIFDREQRLTALKSMLENNFKASMRDVANAWRVFALNDESGTIICSYPRTANKPVIPIPYCDECMTGFEYSFAGLLISDGLVEEGLKVVRAIRERYDGKKRNPWNEIECGNNYARAMASFALLPIFSGFEFDLPKKRIGFSPVTEGRFKCLWSLGTGWGDFIRTENLYRVVPVDGQLELEGITLGGISAVKAVYADGEKIAFTQENSLISFECKKIKRELRIEVKA